MTKVEKLERLTELASLRIRRAASPLHLVEALDDVSDFIEENAEVLPVSAVAAGMRLDAMRIISIPKSMEGMRLEAMSDLGKVVLAISGEAADVDANGSQRHLYIPLDHLGRGPASSGEIVSLMCWCESGENCLALPMVNLAKRSV